MSVAAILRCPVEYSDSISPLPRKRTMPISHMRCVLGFRPVVSKSTAAKSRSRASGSREPLRVTYAGANRLSGPDGRRHLPEG